MNGDSRIKAIILAAGKGVRMRSELPKVLHKLAGKPLVLHVIDNLRRAGIEEIVAVVGYRGELVAETVGSSAKVVWQREQLGTGHAVMQAEGEFRGYAGNVIIACGDVPLLSAASFSRLRGDISDGKTGAVVITMLQENPRGYGRIIRGDDGSLLRIVEEKDASDEERKIQEVNTGTYVFNASLLFDGLKTIGTDNAQGEYYLPDVLGYIRRKGFLVKAHLLENAVEGTGINSREELLRLEDELASRGAGR